ncbi:unnamed protein product, partial [Sphacelaria rigidula]
SADEVAEEPSTENDVKIGVSDDVAHQYSLDDQGVAWLTKDTKNPLLAIPSVMVPNILALVHSLHGHIGVGATLSLMRDRFFWQSIVK